MAKRTRVVWSEGLLLTPQHLQHFDRFHDAVDAELFQAARPFNYGLKSLELDTEAIHNGQVVVHAVSGVTPGGTVFSAPDRDPGPAGRSLGDHFEVSMNEFPVYLGLRRHRPGERQLADSSAGDGDVRYKPDVVKLYDEVSGESEREVQVASANLRLLFGHENLGDYDHLQIAEVVRKPEGGFAYRENYIPPCIGIGASAYIQKTLSKFLDLLVSRSKSLSDRRQHRGQGVAEFSRDDVAGFWLLGSVNKYIPVLSHYLRGRNNHPETVYQTLAAMAGELTTMSDLEVRDIPPYEHEHLDATFTDLAERLPKMLREVLPQNYDRIKLTQREPTIHVGEISDDRLMEPSRSWYLGVFANLPTETVQAKFPDQAKIAPPDRIDFLIQNAIRGVEMRHVQTLPPSLPVQAGTVYFQIEKSGDVWGLVAEAHALAIYVPTDFVGLKLELIALKG